jgi:hypothetical protein
MATLTADEIEYIRAMSGDVCETYDVSDVLMQKLHDRGLEMTCGCTAAEDVTVVLVLRARVAKAARLTNESSEGVSTSYSQKYVQLKELLDQWESKCGLSGGTITIGTLDMGLDSDCSGSEYTRYPGLYGWWNGL